MNAKGLIEAITDPCKDKEHDWTWGAKTKKTQWIYCRRCKFKTGFDKSTKRDLAIAMNIIEEMEKRNA